ncbi:unnamed protein product [Aspergillus oryzae]|uniref:Unnamed protein product n=1 Tax=Aspergillus oryzae TaxID=5062 RepID=A0AAN5BSX0_ASPOZ|nr:unnamed protein product [Aspergillus oryzae]GMF85487.1 unnamed protein product [Aspergillus oryzae]GMG10026.1 unnamed protein product [Aspergillus oryzae]GMG23182.1 unnamed protein product [Aspergillus oryzae]
MFSMDQTNKSIDGQNTHDNHGPAFKSRGQGEAGFVGSKQSGRISETDNSDEKKRSQGLIYTHWIMQSKSLTSHHIHINGHGRKAKYLTAQSNVLIPAHGYSFTNHCSAMQEVQIIIQ